MLRLSCLHSPINALLNLAVFVLFAAKASHITLYPCLLLYRWDNLQASSFEARVHSTLQQANPGLNWQLPTIMAGILGFHGFVSIK